MSQSSMHPDLGSEYQASFGAVPPRRDENESLSQSTSARQLPSAPPPPPVIRPTPDPWAAWTSGIAFACAVAAAVLAWIVLPTISGGSDPTDGAVAFTGAGATAYPIGQLLGLAAIGSGIFAVGRTRRRGAPSLTRVGAILALCVALGAGIIVGLAGAALSAGEGL